MKLKEFTLIEVLIVSAMIGILTSILIPSLGKARDKAKSALCISNMKQLGLSTHLYAGDNQDHFPGRVVSGGNISYDDYLAGYDGRDPLSNTQKSANGLTEAEVAGRHKIYVCPSSIFTSSPKRSYAINLLGTDAQMNWFRGISSSSNPKTVTVAGINMASKTIAYGEREDNNSTMGKTSRDVTSAKQMHKDLYESFLLDGNEFHVKKSSYVMVDGHVESLGLTSTLVDESGNSVSVDNITGTLWDAWK